MLRIKTLVYSFIMILSLTPAFAQEIREESTLNYTYIGPVFSASYNSAEYTDWIDDKTRTKKISGNSYTGGLDLKIIAGMMCGDFQTKYSYSSYDSTLTCIEFLLSGQYFYRINELVSAGGGFGIYMETPPSSKDHNGSAGFYIPLSAMFSINQNTKFFADIYGKYGTFGLGDNTEFISFGCNIGLVFKVGRI